MNKKIVLLTFLFLSCFCSLFAQDESTSRSLIKEEVDYGEPNQTYNTYKTTWQKNKFKDNWVITVAGGAQVKMGKNDSKGDFKDRITFAPQLSIGKYFSPIWGLRFNLTGGSLHGFNDGQAGTYRKWNHGTKHYLGQGYVNTPGYPQFADASQNSAMLTWDPQWNYLGFSLGHPEPEKNIIYDYKTNTYRWNGGQMGLLYMKRVRYVQANIDFMFDFFNLVGDYNPKRFFEITPFAGIGLYNAFSYRGNDNMLAFGGHGGIIAKFRLSDRFGINAEFAGSILPEDFDGQSGDHTSQTGIAQGTLGLSYKIGKTTWEVAEPMDYELINTLNNQINELRERNTTLSKKTCPSCPPPPPVVDVVEKEPSDIRFLPDPVFFKIDKAVIDNSEWAKIDKAANYLLEHPDDNVVVTGYADKQTGYPNYNMKLSERRAKAVAQALVEKYGINPLRISINWSGSEIQPFKVNDWNRAVIFVIE